MFVSTPGGCSTLEGMQYTGGDAVHWRGCSTLEGVQYTGGGAVHWRGCSTLEGYHEYTGRYSVHRGVIMSTVGDTVSTPGGVQYTRGIS